MKHVLGIGGIFFKANDPAKLGAWYRKHLGLDVEDYGGRFALAGLQENVRSIFETARLDKVFLIYPHVDAALSDI